MTSEVEWRRGWKPDLKVEPWRRLKIDDDVFLAKYLFSNDGYEILITDMTSVWYEKLSGNELKKRSQKLNPSVEAPVSKLLDHIKDNLDTKKKDTNYSVAFKNLVDNDDQKILLTINTKLAGLPFVWKFNGSPAEKSMGSEHLVVPLLSMVGELSRRQQELFKLLRSKDKEIDDLKAQGARASRKHLETGTFDETVFTNNMVASQGFLDQIRHQGSETFSVAGQDLYRDLMMKEAWIHRAPRSADNAADTFADEASMETAGVASGTAPSWANRVPPSLAGSVSPTKSPVRNPSPRKSDISSPEASPTKDTELLRRQALERKLADAEDKKEQKKKKKKLKL